MGSQSPGLTDQPPRPPGGHAWRRRIDGLGTTRFFLVVFVPLVLLYLATATWDRPISIDPFSNNLTAWNLGTHGTPFLDNHRHLAHPDYTGDIGWVVPARDGRAASQYPPGASLVAAPLYAVWPADAVSTPIEATESPGTPTVDVLIPPFAPAAIAAAVTAALAMAFSSLAFRRLSDATTALVGAAVFGLGTAVWSVAADALWQHGPAMMWISLGALLTASAAPLPLAGSGVAFGLAIVTRPPTAVIAAATGLYQSWRDRSPRNAVLIGIGSAAGLAAVVAYNAFVFGELSISGGYGSGFGDRARVFDLLAYGKNVGLALASPTRGVLVWSPFLLVLLPGLRAGWKAAPAWVRGAAIGGLIYLLLQLQLNRFSGGGAFPTYRYPLETLAATAPLFLLAYTEWVAKRPAAVVIFRWVAAFSIAAHAIFAVAY